MRFLVTGGTGFLGSHLVRLLRARDHEVIVLHRASSDLRPLDGVPVARAVGDVTEPASLVGTMRDLDGVFHVAGLVAVKPRLADRLARVNIEGTRNVLSAALAQGVGRVVVTSSIAAIGGRPDGGEADESTPYEHPAGLVYNESKREAEQVCWHYAKSGLEVVVANPSIVLGPGEWTQKARPLVALAARGLLRFWPEGGCNIVDVRDVAAGHLAAFERGRSGERYLLGGENLTHRELLTMICEAAGQPPPRLRLPKQALRVGARLGGLLERVLPLPAPAIYLDLVQRHSRYSAARAQRELGFATRPARETLRDTVDWYRAAGLA
jgi:dihydroflavonol-4-reductase